MIMVKKLMNFKKHFNSLGKYTRFFIKASLTTVFSCFAAAIACYFIKDYSQNFTFFYNTAEELLVITRSSSFISLIMTMLLFRIEKQ
jgi:hypothetical protein